MSDLICVCSVLQWFFLIPSTCFVLYKYVLRTWSHFTDRRIQFVRGIPIFGSRYRSILGLDNESTVLNNLYQAHPAEPFIGIFEQFGKPTYLIRDPKVAQQLGDSLRRKISVEEENGDRFVSDANAKLVYDLISQNSEEFCESLWEKLKSGECDYEAKELFGRFASNVIGGLALGQKINTLEHSSNAYYRVCSAMNEYRSAQNISALDYLGLNAIIQYISAIRSGKKIENHFKTVMLEKVGKRLRKCSPRSSLVDFLISTVQNVETKAESECCANSSETCLDRRILNEYINFLWDGFNIVQCVMPFLVFELALNPDIQTNLFRELWDARTTHGDKINYDTISQLNYLDMVLSETLRRWTPVQFRRETISKPATMDGLKHITVRLNVGDSVWIPTYPPHMDESNFRHAEKFHPERFNDQNKPKIKPNVFNPFGVCENKHSTDFAVMQLKTLVYHFLLTFIIDKCEETPDPLKLQTGVSYLTSESGFWIGLRMRGE